MSLEQPYRELRNELPLDSLEQSCAEYMGLLQLHYSVLLRSNGEEHSALLRSNGVEHSVLLRSDGVERGTE